MKLLTFLAMRFAWTPGEAVSDAAREDVGAAAPSAGELHECVVVFVHADVADEDPARRASLLRRSVKHVQWLARKRASERCVLHSFTHLGARTASADFARGFLDELAARLTQRGFTVRQTPFGWSSAWELSVHGEGIAKVWKDLTHDDPEGGLPEIARDEAPDDAR